MVARPEYTAIRQPIGKEFYGFYGQHFYGRAGRHDYGDIKMMLGGNCRALFTLSPP
jgi:hypothetical protein